MTLILNLLGLILRPNVVYLEECSEKNVLPAVFGWSIWYMSVGLIGCWCCINPLLASLLAFCLGVLSITESGVSNIKFSY